MKLCCVRVLAFTILFLVVCREDSQAQVAGRSQTEPPDSLFATDGYPRIIRNIYIDRIDVFDPEHDDWFFGAPLLNALHTRTQQFVVEDELLFTEGNDVDPERLLETERNLRRRELFSRVRVTTTLVGDDSVDVAVLTQDQFSLRPALLFGTGGGITNVGFKLEELNLFGTGTHIMGSGLYRTENDIGWEGALMLTQRRLFGSEIGVKIGLLANQFRTDQLLEFVKPYRTMNTAWAFGLAGANAYGRDFAYLTETILVLPFHDRNVRGWISQSYGEDDQLFMSASAKLTDVQRTIPESRQAYDNTGHLLVSFSSIQQLYTRSKFLDGYETEDVQTGGYGSAILGRVFSMGNGGETFWYIGAEGEQSFFPTDDVYLFGKIAGASGFGANRPLYTFLEVRGLGHWRLDQNIMLTAQIRTQTAWNWTAYRQLVLDFESGLRGYSANALAGDNRVVGNAEFRWFPGWKWWILGFSGVAFYDVGTVWNQGDPVSSTRYHHAVGLGFRIHNTKASGGDAIYRFDFAFNLDENRFAGLIFSTNQLFSAFGSHKYRPPDVIGSEIDVQ